MRFVPASVSRSISRQALKARKNSPHLLFFGGVLGIGVSTVLACRATLELEKELDEIKHDLESVRTMKLDFERDKQLQERKPESYSDYEYHRDLIYVYGKSTFKVLKLYGLPVVVGSLSIAALTGSHVQLTRRNAALTFTLAAMSKAFDDYRARVQEVVGESKEREIYRDLQDTEVEVDGKTKIVKTVGPNAGSIYAREFNDTNPNWVNSDEYNRIFIEIQQKYANDRLLARGHVFLNEVYTSLGLPHTQPGAVVGWLKNGDGDKFIDFGLYDGPNQTHHLISVGQVFYLDFNVDGSIWDKI